MSEIITSDLISRRRALSLVGWAAVLGLAAPAAVLTASRAGAQTPAPPPPTQDGFSPAGVRPITQVCSLQIFMEALGRRRGDHRRIDLLEITNALKALPGWRALPGNHRLPGYGPQKVFERIPANTNDGMDLI